MKLSIVSTLYYSSSFIEEFYSRCIACMPKVFSEYEFIFVNDGSPDNSIDVAQKLCEKDKNIIILDLSRNFGHHKAIMAALGHSDGDYVFLIDIDLEEEPELLDLFWKRFNTDADIDVVYGVQDTRKGNVFEKVSGGLFYTLFNFFSETKIPANLLMARLMKRNYVNSLLEYGESELFLGGVFAHVGYVQAPEIVKKNSKGSTTYTLQKRLHLFVNAITSFSSKPLKMIFYLGIWLSFFSTIFLIYIIIRYLLYDMQMGWTSVIASVWFLGSLMIMSIGVVGIYISKVFSESKKRPNYIIKNKHIL